MKLATTEGMEIKTLAEAYSNYETSGRILDVLYWSGKPCEKGHDSPRYTRNDTCKVCDQLKLIARKAKKNRKVVHTEATHGIMFRKF